MLGLFKTRIPRFPQLFFHEFSEAEIYQKQGQSPIGPTVSHRAGMAYVGSGIRLESQCGMSDIWYWYLERNSDLFGGGPTSFIQGPESPPLPHLNPDHMGLFVSMLGWKEDHRQRHLRKKTIELVPKGIGSRCE